MGMLRKPMLPFLAIVMFNLHITVLYAADFNFNQNSVKGLAQSLGFVQGQEFTLERISKEYPELSLSVTLARAQFDSSFPNIKLKLRDQLTLAMGEVLFKKTEANIKSQIKTSLEVQELTKDIAQDFLEQVKERAEGNIDSPVIEYLLSVGYMRYPAGEYVGGYRQRFSSDSHRKSQGIKLVLQTPKSWKAEEGERPHIVQKWTSQNGTGLEMMHLDIRDTEGYTPTNNEVESFVAAGEVKKIVPSGATYINSGLFSLEMRKGFWMEMSLVQERVGIKLYTHSSMYQLFFRGKAIGLMCQASRPLQDKAAADEAFRRIKPLCQKVLNSIVLLQVY